VGFVLFHAVHYKQKDADTPVSFKIGWMSLFQERAGYEVCKSPR